MKAVLATIGALLALGYSSSAMAGVECGIAYVMGSPQQVCWLTDEPGAGGGEGGGSGGGGGGEGGSGGGGLDPEGVWVTVNGNEVNVLKKEVRNMSLSCSDEDVVLIQAVQSIVVKNPWMALGTVVKLTVSDGSQRYARVNTVGSLQFQGVSACG